MDLENLMCQPLPFRALSTLDHVTERVMLYL